MKSRFESWVQEHHAAVYRTALRIVRNVEDAEDVTQEVFLKALQQADRLGAAEDPGRVLCWISAKAALMHLRGDRRRRHREDEVSAMQNNAPEPNSPDNSQQVASLLQRLPEELRLALSLRFQERLTFAQISEVMSISQPSAHDRVQRGLAKLREWLQRSSPALLAVSLEEQLQAQPLAPVPAGLRDRLLGLEAAKAATVAVGAKVLTALVLTVAVAAALALGPLSNESPDRLATWPAADLANGELNPHSSSSTPEVKPNPRSAIPSSEVAVLASATEQFAEISGRVLQPDSSPAAQATVIASSFAQSGKTTAYAGRALTNESGEYTLRVPADHEDGDDYQLHVQYEQARLSRPVGIRVHTGETRSSFDLTLEVPIEEIDGSYELDLAIEEEDGLFLPAGCLVTLERELRTIGGGSFAHWENGGQLDVAGRVRFRGTKLGPKRVLVSRQIGDEWLRYVAHFEVEHSGVQARTVHAKLVSRQPIWPDAGSLPGKRKPEQFGLRGYAVELATGAPVERADHDIWFYKVPDLTPSELLYDFFPNKIFRAPFQSAAISEQTPPTTDEFSSFYALSAGRYVAVGYEQPYAPAFSDVVELTEEYPWAEGLRLDYEAPGALTGVLLDSDGSPIENGILFLSGSGPLSDKVIAGLDEHVRKSRGEGNLRHRSWSTDSEGRFRIEGLPSQIPVRVIAVNPWREPASSVTVFASPSTLLEGVDVRFVRQRTR